MTQTFIPSLYQSDLYGHTWFQGTVTVMFQLVARLVYWANAPGHRIVLALCGEVTRLMWDCIHKSTTIKRVIPVQNKLMYSIFLGRNTKLASVQKSDKISSYTRQTFCRGRRPIRMKIKMHECSGMLQQRGGIPLVLNCTSTALRKKPSETEALKTKFPQLILDSKVSKWGFLRVQFLKGFVALKMQ